MRFRPDIQFQLAMQGKLSTARAFWVVTILYSYIGVFLVVLSSQLLRFSINERVINDVQVLYMCFGIFASFRCTQNIQSVWLRWVARILLGMIAFWLILALQNFVVRLFGR